MGHLLLVSIRPPPATYVCPAAHLTYASAWPPAAVRPPGHPFVVCICWATCCTRARPAARDSRTSPRPLATLASSPDCMRPWHEPPAGRRAHVLHEPGRPPELLGRRSASAGGDYLRTIKAGLGPPVGGIAATGERGSVWTIWSPTHLDHMCDGRGWPRLVTARAMLRQRRGCDGE